jgi:ligand-binding sensor domain-containing protein/signal transduction histidine kinase
LLRAAFLFIIYLATLPAYGQENQRYIFHHIGIQEGLLANEVHATVQDSKGFIWMGSKNGLQRYDGSRFINFRHREGDSTSIPHNNIMRLCVDKKDRLWLITSNAILGYFDINRFIFHEVRINFRNKILSRANGDFYLDEKHGIMLILNGYRNEAWGVVTYDEKRNVFTTGDKRFDVPEDWHTGFLSIDSVHGNYWYATTNGLIKYSPITGNFNYRGHNPDNDTVINALQNFKEVGLPLLDSKGNFWMTTFQDHQTARLIYYDGKNKTITDRTKELDSLIKKYNEVHNIYLDSEGYTWLSGLNMLIRVNDKNKFDDVAENSEGEYSIRFDDLYTFNKDREKNICIATDKGEYWFNPAASLFHTIDLKRYNSNEKLTPDVTDIKQLQNGHILVSTWGAGIFAYDKNFDVVYSPVVEQGLKKYEGLVWSILQRTNGDVWRANQDGWLFIYHSKTNTTERIQDSIFEKKTIRQIAEDRYGNLWLGTQGGALIKWTASTNTFSFIKKMGDVVRRLYADKNGDIWVIAGKIEKINIDDGSVTRQYLAGKADGTHLPSPDLSDIIQYNDSIYVIAGEQLSVLNTHTNRFTYLNTSTGLPSDYITNLVISKKGDLWMSTESGIYAMNFLNSMNSTFGAEDGIINSHFNYGASYRLQDGRIVFGTNHDFVVFDPSHLNDSNYTPPNVEITSVKLFNKRLPVDSLLHLEKMYLNYTDNSLSFEFSTLTYQTRYSVSYRMTGIDKDWITVNASREAVYSYLPPGNYAFQVGSPDGKGNIKNITSLKFHISAPFWKTWEFYAALILLAGIIVWWMYKERIRRMKDVLQMRNVIGKDLHKEVRTTLKNISVLSEIAAMKADNNLEQSKDYIQEIKQKSRRSVIAMDDVMWSIDPVNDSMSKIIERIYDITDILRNEYGTQIDVDINNNLQHYKLSMKQRLEFMFMFKRAMLMLSRDANAPTISVVLEKETNRLAMKLFAPGTELPKFDTKINNSIEEIKSRAASIDSIGDVQSNIKGTAVIAIIK